MPHGSGCRVPTAVFPPSFLALHSGTKKHGRSGSGRSRTNLPDPSHAKICRTQRPNGIGTTNARFSAEHFRMNGVIHQSGNGCAIGRPDSLNHPHASVVQVGCVVIVGNAPQSLAAGSFQQGRLQPVERGIDRRRGLLTNQVEVSQTGGVATLAVGKSLGIGRTVSVRGTNKDVVSGNAWDPGTHPVAQHRGKPPANRGPPRPGWYRPSEKPLPGQGLGCPYRRRWVPADLV